MLDNRHIYRFILSFLAFSVHAHAKSFLETPWWVALETGAAFVNNGSASIQRMPLVNLADTYTVTGLDNTAVLGIGLGYAFKNNRLGLYYDHYFNSTLSGEILKWQSVHVYDYQLQVQSNTFWLNDQLDLIRWGDFIPFIELGIGFSMNESSDYQEQSLPVVPLSDRRAQSADFMNHTHTSFAWRTGVGVNMVLPWLENRFRVGLMYRYTDRGNIQTGASENYPTMDNGLSTQLRSNEIMAIFSYKGTSND